MSAKRDPWLMADTFAALLLLALFLMPKPMKITGILLITCYAFVKFLVLYKAVGGWQNLKTKKAFFYFVLMIFITLYFVYYA